MAWQQDEVHEIAESVGKRENLGRQPAPAMSTATSPSLMRRWRPPNGLAIGHSTELHRVAAKCC
jgi:hypothetical protein